MREKRYFAANLTKRGARPVRVPGEILLESVEHLGEAHHQPRRQVDDLEGRFRRESHQAAEFVFGCRQPGGESREARKAPVAMAPTRLSISCLSSPRRRNGRRNSWPVVA